MKSRISRVPVYGESVDDVTGILQVQGGLPGLHLGSGEHHPQEPLP